MRSAVFRRTGQLVLYAMFCLTIGNAIVSNPGASFGGWARGLAPAAALGVLLLLWITDSFSLPQRGREFIPRGLTRRELSLTLIVLLTLAIPLAVGSLHWYRSNITYAVPFLLSGTGILTACVLIATGNQARGLAALIVSLPVIHFLEYEYRGVVQHNMMIQGPFFVTPALLALCLVGLVSGWKQLADRQPVVFSSLHKAWLLLLVPMLVAALFSPDRMTSFRTVTFFLAISIPFFLTVQSVRTIEEVKLLSIALGVAGAMRVLTFLYHQLFQFSGGITGRLDYFEGAQIMASAMWGAASCVFLLGGWILSQRFSKMKGLSIGVIGIVVVFSVPVLARSSIIAAACGLIAFLAVRGTKWWIVAVIIVVVFALVIFGPFLIQQTALGRFKEFTSWESLLDSQKSRREAWRVAWLMMRDHPWVGIGPGMWLEYLPRYGTRQIYNVSSGYIVSGAHNPYLQSGATAGVAAFLSVLVFTVVTFREAISLFRRERRSPLAPLAMAFVSLTVFHWMTQVLGGGNFEPHPYSYGYYVPWFVFGLVVAWKNAKKGNSD